MNGGADATADRIRTLNVRIETLQVYHLSSHSDKAEFREEE